MQILSTLGIDWRIMAAQLLNFLILVGILSYLVYRPLLRVLDERKNRIRKAMDDAKHIADQRKEIDRYRAEQLKKIDKETAAFLESARVHAEKVKREILEHAQKEANDILEKAKHQLGDERAKLLKEVQSSIADIAVGLAEKVLAREFGDADQKRVLQSLEQHIPELMK